MVEALAKLALWLWLNLQSDSQSSDNSASHSHFSSTNARVDSLNVPSSSSVITPRFLMIRICSVATFFTA